MVCVADSFSAMTSDRPYQSSRELEEACAELERCAGTQFDPQVVRLFVEAVRANPPAGDQPGRVAAALDDPEIQARRRVGEPVLGSGPVGRPTTSPFSTAIATCTTPCARTPSARRDRGPPVRGRADRPGRPARAQRQPRLRGGRRRDPGCGAAVQRAASRRAAVACRHSGRRLALSPRTQTSMPPRHWPARLTGPRRERAASDHRGGGVAGGRHRRRGGGPGAAGPRAARGDTAAVGLRACRRP